MSMQGRTFTDAEVERAGTVVRELVSLSTDRRDLIAWEVAGRLDALVWPTADPGSGAPGGGAPTDPRTR